MFLDTDDVALVLHPEVAVKWDQRGGEASTQLRRANAAHPLEPTSPRPPGQ